MRLKPAKEIDYAELDKSRSYTMFRRAVKSEKTLYAYKHSLREFLKYTNLSSYDEITKLSTDRVQEILENWIMDLSAKDIKGSSIRIKLAPVELFLDMKGLSFTRRYCTSLFRKMRASLEEMNRLQMMKSKVCLKLPRSYEQRHLSTFWPLQG